MDKIIRIASRTVVLPQADIDTDQIVPARFLTTTDRKSLGKALFADWRYDAEGRELPDFVLNRPESEGAAVLVAGNNFGCGSSREHAPWALVDYGFRAIISTQIADIFRTNALKNGLVPVVVDAGTHGWLTHNPGAEVVVDVEYRTLTLPDGRKVDFVLDGFSRYCLMEGLDQLGYLLQQDMSITEYERDRPWQP